MSLIASAPARSARRATAGENVSAVTRMPRSLASPSTAGTRRAASRPDGTGGPLRAATAPTSIRSKPSRASRTPSRTAWSAVSLRAPG